MGEGTKAKAAPPPEGEREDDDEPNGSFELSDKERHEVKDKLPPRVQVLHETIRVQGKIELGRSFTALAWSSLAAGLSMGFSMLIPALLHVHLIGVPGGFLISKLGYSVGFLIVIVARQQLFTENTMTAVLPLMTHPGWLALRRLLRLWGIVLVGNLVGVALFACAMVYMRVIDAPTRDILLSQGHGIMLNSWLQMFTKAIVAGWLIATMVWLVPAVPQAKVGIIVLMTYLIGLGNFTHIIAGSTEVLFLVFEGQLGPGDYLWQFALPTMLGNIVGGSLIFGLISHAQVRSDEH